MAQNFNSLKASSLIKNDRQTINDNFNAVRSCHSGTAYPTSELIAGMLFFNTSTKKLYEYNVSAWVQIFDLSSGTAVATKAGDADNAKKATGDKNGKDITTYVAKLEQDANNKFAIRVYNGADTLMTTITIPKTEVDVMTGASASSAGKAGLVPAPTAGAKNRYLNAYGEFDSVPVTSVNGKIGDVGVGEVTDLSISGKTITVTFADGTTKTLTTQDTVGSIATTIGGASATKPAVVVTTYRSGYSWYRVWSDGWVEQGGRTATRGTITLHRAFANTEYTISVVSEIAKGKADYTEGISSITTTNFYLDLDSNGSVNATGARWYACGQGA